MKLYLSFISLLIISCTTNTHAQEWELVSPAEFNPTYDVIIIPGNTEQDITIYNVYIQMIEMISTQPFMTKIKINISHYIPGIYTIQSIGKNGNTKTYTFVKK
ncbi:MAG: hypothetical protein JEZ03_08910 [Bacteroidales bacterium]|nr:hypothetical protein [Bacteroidales bacterium]